MSVLDKLRGGLVVSCQPVDDGPMDRPEIIAAMAQAAVAGGARGVRVEGVENLRAVRSSLAVPIIGIVKEDAPDTPVRITPKLAHVAALSDAGADVIAYDGTPRTRYDAREAILAAIIAHGKLAMADCATESDGRIALAAGATILGTTLSGYTDETGHLGAGPDLFLVRSFRALGGFVMAEGRYDTPTLAVAAMSAGADAVTVGSALTRLELMTAKFSQALEPERK